MPERAARPTDDELWGSVEHTVREVLLPAIDDEWARATAIQLVGLARYARERPPGAAFEHDAERAKALSALSDNPIVARHWSGSLDPAEVLAAAGAVLADAVGDDGPAGDEVRAVLRPVIVRQLDDDLAITAPLVPYFRGQLDA